MKTVIAIVMAACIGLSCACVKEASPSSAESGDVLGADQDTPSANEAASLGADNKNMGGNQDGYIGDGVPSDVGFPDPTPEWAEPEDGCVYYLIVEKMATLLLMKDWRAREEGSRVVTGPFPLREEDVRVVYEFMGKDGLEKTLSMHKYYKYYEFTNTSKPTVICLYDDADMDLIVCAVFRRDYECMVVSFNGCTEEEKWMLIWGVSY